VTDVNNASDEATARLEEMKRKLETQRSVVECTLREAKTRMAAQTAIEESGFSRASNSQSNIWNDGGAKSSQFLTRAVRFISGIFALLIATLCLYIGISSARLAESNVPPLNDQTVGSLYLVALVGAGLVSFAISEAMQLFWVGADEIDDDRLWSHLASTERGLFKLRLSARWYWSVRIWCALSTITFIAMTVFLRHWIARNFSAIGYEFVFMTALTFAVLWVSLKLSPSKLSGDKPDVDRSPAWISANRWTLTAAGRSWEGFPLTIAMGLFWSSMPLFDTRHHYTPLNIGVSIFGMIILIWAAIEALEVRRRLKYGTVTLALTRQNTRPLFFHGQINFSTPIKSKDISVPWSMRLFARGYLRGVNVPTLESDYFAWIKVTAPIIMSLDGKTGTFELTIELPETIPRWATLWEIRVMRANRKKPVRSFGMPREAIFVEEYPVS
jgi:hypothetical protein